MFSPLVLTYLDVVLAAGFSTLYYDTKLASMDLTASSTITTVEKLMKGDQVIFRRYFHIREK